MIQTSRIDMAKVENGVAQAQGEPLHLSDEQFASLLLGAISPAVQSHLESCARCAEESERVGLAIGSFERDSRLWADRRAAATPAAYPVRQPIPAWLQLPTAWAVAAVAVVIATTLGLPHFGDHGLATGQASSLAVTSMPAAAAEVPAATLKADNDLLSAIDGKLRANDTQPAQFYGLQVDATLEPSRSAHEVAD